MRKVHITFSVVVDLDDDDEGVRNAADMVAMRMVEHANLALSGEYDAEWPREARRVVWVGRGMKTRVTSI